MATADRPAKQPVFGAKSVPSHHTDEHLQLIEDCEQRESRLTEWERDFIDSVKDQIGRGRRPSVKQIDALDSIWERATAKG